MFRAVRGGPKAFFPNHRNCSMGTPPGFDRHCAVWVLGRPCSFVGVAPTSVARSPRPVEHTVPRPDSRSPLFLWLAFRCCSYPGGPRTSSDRPPMCRARTRGGLFPLAAMWCCSNLGGLRPVPRRPPLCRVRTLGGVFPNSFLRFRPPSCLWPEDPARPAATVSCPAPSVAEFRKLPHVLLQSPVA